VIQSYDIIERDIRLTCPSFKTTFGSLSPTLTSGIVVAEEDMFNVVREIGNAVLGTKEAVLCWNEANSNVMEDTRPINISTDLSMRTFDAATCFV